ncbi:helix-turn-helix domain-containing protein [Parapedobacter sp. 2B3]|uniref:helix-turn-helix domain-containing protein n=1 Tax=Parapedobacter sp. 2B3 TaxID=3342381 RepID=UPI0035B6A3C6
MQTPIVIKELREQPFEEIIRLNCEDEMLKFKAPVLGKGQTAIIPLTQNVRLAYLSGIPLETYKMQYNQYYNNNVLLTISMKGDLVHEWDYTATSKISTRQSFMYNPQGEDSFFIAEKGKKFEQVTLIFSKADFLNVVDKFFDSDQKSEKKKCIDAVFSKSAKGAIFDISKVITIVIKQVLACRLKGNFRKVYMECKLYEIMAHYLNAISSVKQQELKFSTEDVQKLQEAKNLLQNLDQILQLSVKELCKKIGLNRFKLTMGFQAIYNTSVIKFYHQSVLEKAFEELHHNKTDSITNIAIKYGYGTTQAFSTAFQKQFGIRPSEVQ